MKRSIFICAALSLGLCLGLRAAPAADGAAILKAMDANSAFKTASYEATLTITSGKRQRVKTMKAVAAGENALVEFTNPEDRGVKYLRLGSDLWIYFPEENDTVRIAGTQLKEGFMGSDVSYEDALDPSTLFAVYDVAVEGAEEVDGRACAILSLTAKAKGAPYDKRRLWVDTDRSIALKEEMYSKSGILLKSSRITAVENSGGHWYAKRFEMRDARKKDSLTVFELSSMRYDVAVDQKRFSLQGLKK